MSFVSVVIPALNEENAISKVIGELPKDRVQEIIVVDNGSKDQTVQMAKEAGALVLKEPIPGYGRAVLKGLTQISKECEIVVILDGDHSDFPEELPKLLNPIEKKEADFVIGSRTKWAHPQSLTIPQRFGNRLTCSLIRFFYGVQFTDMGPFRAIRRQALDSFKMQDQNFGWNVEMQVKAIKKKLRIVEVPVHYRPRIGFSKISGTIKGTVMAGIIILWSLFKYGLQKPTSS